MPLPFSAMWRIDSVHIENRISDESTLFASISRAACARPRRDLLAEQRDALTAQLRGGALGLGGDADGGALGLGLLGLADQQRVALVGRRGLQVVRRHDLRHRGGDRLVEGDVVELQVDEVVAPGLDA